MSRTKRDVEEARRNVVMGGCCERFANQQACDCLERATEGVTDNGLMSHPEYKAFLAAIIAAPDDDAPRLACADWLEEHGDASRAEFIRVQCELSRLTANDYESKARCPLPRPKTTAAATAIQIHQRLLTTIENLRRRERELTDGNWERWRPFLRLLPNVRRGFIECVTLSWDDWLQHADALLAASPIREVELMIPPRLPGMLVGYTSAIEALKILWPRVTTWRVPG